MLAPELCLGAKSCQTIVWLSAPRIGEAASPSSSDTRRKFMFGGCVSSWYKSVAASSATTIIKMSTSNTLRISLAIPESLSAANNAFVQFSVDNGKCEVFPPDVQFQLDELQSTDDELVKVAPLPRASVRVFPDGEQPVALKVWPPPFRPCVSF